jgi:hypothetical protein
MIILLSLHALTVVTRIDSALTKGFNMAGPKVSEQFSETNELGSAIK